MSIERGFWLQQYQEVGYSTGVVDGGQHQLGFLLSLRHRLRMNIFHTYSVYVVDYE